MQVDAQATWDWWCLSTQQGGWTYEGHGSWAQVFFGRHGIEDVERGAPPLPSPYYIGGCI